eukprot:200213_1
MEVDILKQRAIFADKFKKSFETLTNSYKFKQIMKSYNLDKYTFKILTKVHRDEAIHILCTQFSQSGGCFSSLLFNLSYEDRIPHMTPLVDHAIDTGTSFITLDENNKFAGIIIIFDEMDKFQIENKQQLPDRYIKMLEMDETLTNSDPWYKLMMQYKANGAVSFGEIVAVDRSCLRSDLVGQSLHMVLNGLIYPILAGIESCKWRHSTVVHPSIFYLLNTVFFKLFNEHIKGGYMRMTSKLNLYDYIKEKCETDKWYQKHFDQENVFKNVIKRKDDCIGFNVVNFERIRDNYDPVEFFKAYVDYYMNHIQKRKSKL